MYIDAYHDRKTDKIKVVERVDGKRIYKEYPAEYTFYYEHPAGTYKSLFGHSLKKFTTDNHTKFKRELGSCNAAIFESDINPIFRCLSKYYASGAKPSPNLGFFDIEVAFDPVKGYASVDDPFNEITAISIYLSHIDKLVALCIPPKSMSYDEAEKELEGLENVIIFDDEGEMLKTFLLLIEDVDILSGWNSAGFDIPYIVNRIERTLGSDYTKLLCLFDLQPKKRVFTKFNKEHTSFDLIGRIHLDYLELYQKHSPKQLHSYRLDYVGELEIGEKKVPYEGTLDTLYNKEFRKFIEYSLQDTMLLKKMDDKLKYIDLANGIAHTNGVLFQTTKGSVALIEQAIINEAHSLGLIVYNKKPYEGDEEEIVDEDEDEDAVAGAYVVDPKVGLHQWIGSVDINSLYPSAIRTFNMSPETLVGQLRTTRTNEYLTNLIRNEKMSGTAAWATIFTVLEFEDVIEKTQNKVWVDFEDGTSVELTGAEIHYMIFESGKPWCITANGTIFRYDKEGIIPHILTRWYKERQSMQKISKSLYRCDVGLDLDDDLIAELTA